jgi:hypothetical protein
LLTRLDALLEGLLLLRVVDDQAARPGMLRHCQRSRR